MLAVSPVTPAPMGVGIVYAGMNDARVHDTWIFDNWRNGAMLFSVPDAFVCGDSSPTNPGNEQHGCNEGEVNTSFRNEFRLGGALTVSFLLDGQFGHELWNQTRHIMDISLAGPLYDRQLRGEITAGILARW